MEIIMTAGKETKGTYVYEAPDSLIPTLYIKKGAFETQPDKIKITVESV